MARCLLFVLFQMEVRKITNKEAIKYIVDGAAIFDAELRNKNLLVIFGAPNVPQYIELSISPSNFLHLTGVKLSPQSKIKSAKAFYNAARKRKLKETDFKIKDGTTEQKLKVLCQTLNLSQNAKIIGDYNGNHINISVDKMAGSVFSCMGFNKIGDYFKPITLLQSDVRSEVVQQHKILAILSKNQNEHSYNKICKQAKDIEIQPLLKRLSADISIDETLFSDFQRASKPTVTNIMTSDKAPPVQMAVNADGTIAVQNNFQFQFPTPDDFIKAVKDTVAYIGNAINIFELKVSKALNEVFNPQKSKPKSVSKARTTKSDKSTVPKKKAFKTPQSVSERKSVKQVAQDKPQAQETKKSVLADIASAKKEIENAPKSERTVNKIKNKNKGL